MPSEKLAKRDPIARSGQTRGMDYVKMKKSKVNKPPSEEYARFEKLARQLIAVPKSEIDKRQAEYAKKKAAKKPKAA